jgi:hypothetical protein
MPRPWLASALLLAVLLALAAPLAAAGRCEDCREGSPCGCSASGCSLCLCCGPGIPALLLPVTSGSPLATVARADDLFAGGSGLSLPRDILHVPRPATA